MNENEELELLDLEAELSALRPAAVDDSLLAVVESDFPSTSVTAVADSRVSKMNVIQGFFSRHGQVAAAALLVLSSGLLFLVSNGDSPSDPASTGMAASQVRPAPSFIQGDRFHRVGESSKVIAPMDAGVTVKEGQPYRVWNFEVQEEQQWTNPADGTDIKVKQPSKEQMFVPLRVL